MRHLLTLVAAASLAPMSASAQDAPATPAGKEALALLTRGIAFRTVEGQGQVPAYAAYLKQQLVSAGFADADVAFVPMGETGYLTARYPGRDRGGKATIVLGHMDVVQADPKDWTRDPFTPVVEGGYVYGRGSLDNKAGVSTAVAALMKLRRARWVPQHDVVLVLTGDEETTMKTTRAAAAAFKDAGLVLNADAGGGSLGDDGKPIVYGVQAAEKVYGDWHLTVTDPGGHSSRPGPRNAIASLAAALVRIAAYRFPPEQNEITKASLAATAKGTPGPLGDAMRAFVANPADTAAADRISADPRYVGQVRTTCVPTMVSGGHAPNALPQRATANINCRIFPGTSRAAIETRLIALTADPSITVALFDNGTIEAGASPLDPKVMAAVRAVAARRAPGLAVVPLQEAGATDSMHFRARGIPSFGVGGVFMKPGDIFAHGLNERVPVATIDPAVSWWEGLLTALG
ncbi:M20/M25/M40 family metallo-hydrolase [Sphingomonas sp. A2-49]|uniref:M20/M25/M40 family metallo-hydrolase n=1 Tax=Sphingomonas sp. A2-49 TaxID=1391375 RepID=UPI0021D184AD|nr:M20/M25/M40 family metallo-hydrolase [Sphingomonas sp. A2-49]MCU6455378.1 M20/M25/M40 family metallo-hydrolase [Sphingomonas sp. A2-49]